MAAGNACWGIEIGAGAVKALKLVVDGDKVVVADFAYIPHAKVLSTPDIDPDDAKRVALGRLVSEYDMSGASIAVSVPGHSAFARFAKLPPVDPKKVPDIVKFEAVQQIPFPLAEVEWDYQTFVSPDSPDVEVGIFAITKARIAGELAILQDVNLTPDVVTLSPVAAYNAIAYDLEFTDRSPGTILLDVGTTSTDLIIADAGRVWIRTFPVGGHEFTKALVDQFKLGYPKAEKLKREAESTKHARHVFQALRPVFGDLVQDVQRSIGYYQSLHREAKLERLIGMGSTFNLPGLRKFLKQQLGMNVYRIEQFKRVAAEGPRAAELQGLSLNFCTAYGLALQGLGLAALQANLMPVGVRREAIWAKKGRWFAAAAGLALAATGAMFIRPIIDSASESIQEPAEITNAVRKAGDLRRQAEEAGVTGDGGGSFDASNMLAMFEGRGIYPLLMRDVDTMLADADRHASSGGAAAGLGGFRMHSMRTQYFFGTEPPKGGQGPAAQEAEFDPYNMGLREEEGMMISEKQTREEAMRKAQQPMGDDGAPAEGEPRVLVTLELSTYQPQVGLFVEESVKRWVEVNARRDGVPYRLESEHFDWKPIREVALSSGEPGQTAALAAGQPAQGRRGADRTRELREREMQMALENEGEGVLPEAGLIGESPTREAGTRAPGGAGAPPADVAQALAELEKLAPLSPMDDAHPADARIETFVSVTFSVVIGAPEALSEDEGGEG